MTNYSFNLTEKEIELLDHASRAREQAYTPYSEFPVGAAVLTGDDTIYDGGNIENASYGLTMCAERTVIFKAVSDGYQQFKALAVSGKSNSTAQPCGACRQVMREFDENLTIVLHDSESHGKKIELSSLLPDSFGPDSL